MCQNEHHTNTETHLTILLLNCYTEPTGKNNNVKDAMGLNKILYQQQKK
jgi:hypothetical protein